jgi:hypothetical protein
MKTLNLFLKMHFTSLSPDGQPISLAIVSDPFLSKVNVGDETLFGGNIQQQSNAQYINNSKSFYAEFSGFDIRRCDDWVKENVVSKLQFNHEIYSFQPKAFTYQSIEVKAKSWDIKYLIDCWISQFSDYKLNFVVDCGWFCWGKFVELMGEWENISLDFDYSNCNPMQRYEIERALKLKRGLPKLPANFPPVPQDLNDLISQKKGISVSEAFELDREELASGMHSSSLCSGNVICNDGSLPHKYNALWDAKVTKAIYEKLK